MVQTELQLRYEVQEVSNLSGNGTATTYRETIQEKASEGYTPTKVATC